MSLEIARNCKRRRTSAKKRDSASRLTSSERGTLRCRRMNAIFHGCYGGRKSAGSRKQDRRIREAREKQSFGRTCVYIRASKKSAALSHDGERLMLFDESRRHSSLSRIIVAIFHSLYESNIYIILSYLCDKTYWIIRFCHDD